MSTNEELFADVKEHLAHNVWDDEIFVLADRLVTAFEKVTVERDELLSAEELAAEDRGRLIEELRKVTAERDELRESITELEPSSADYRIKRLERTAEDAKRGYDQLAAVVKHVGHVNAQSVDYERFSRVRYALMEAPPAALDRVKAEAWEEGHKAMSLGQIENPYLKGESNE